MNQAKLDVFYVNVGFAPDWLKNCLDQRKQTCCFSNQSAKKKKKKRDLSAFSRLCYTIRATRVIRWRSSTLASLR